VFERGDAEGAFRDDLPARTLAEVYFGLLEGTVSRAIHGRLGVEQASAAITGILLNGALAPSGHGHRDPPTRGSISGRTAPRQGGMPSA
jgi:hypothetical protein